MTAERILEGMAEETLMDAYAQGDERAFRPLFAKVAPSVHAFFLRSFRDASVADDLMQQTFLRLHRARAAYRSELPLRPWLFTMAASVRRDELRRLYRLPPHVGEEECERAEIAIATQAEPSCNEASPAADAVRAALDRLPETQRVVIHLHRYESLTFEQIAAALGTTPGAVRVRASRAYETLRDELKHLLAEKRGEP